MIIKAFLDSKLAVEQILTFPYSCLVNKKFTKNSLDIIDNAVFCEYNIHTI